MVVVIADSRERNSGVPEILSSMNITVAFKQLDVADYIISDAVAIERKSASDFISSIFDGRLFDQAYRLSNTYERAIIIVEKELAGLETLVKNPQIIRGAIISLTIRHGVNVIFSKSIEETAELIKLAAEHEQKTGKKIIIKHKPKLSTTKDWQINIIGSLPGIGPKLAERLLLKFTTVRSVFQAKSSELEAILGSERTKKILEIIDAPYTSELGLNKKLLEL
ncbi:MAG: ERCC4 domain-containing protein [Thermoprotei archaeon]